MSKSEEVVTIIGGGAAGIMAALSVGKHHPNKKVILVDRTFALGRKILVCGAGRCNITNHNLAQGYKDHYYGSPTRFIGSVFNQFGYADIVQFFNELGIDLYLERKTDVGKMFPITNQAKTVTALLEDELIRHGVEVHLNTEVKLVKAEGNGERQFVLEVEPVAENDGKVGSKRIYADQVIIAAGGKTYPALGSNGSGYRLAERLGHGIVKPVVSAVPLVSENPLSHFLQGVRLDAEVTSLIDSTARKTRTDELMFTAYGFSGPVILDVSREYSLLFNREGNSKALIKINFLPGYTPDTALQMLDQRWGRRPKQSLEKSFYGIFPNKFPAVFIRQMLQLDPNLQVGQLDNNSKRALTKALTGSMFPINGTRGWNEGEFTAGGVNAKEIKAGTLESKLIPGLYFCGEIVNVDGDVGGYNLSWSWSSGYVAGKLA